MNTPVFDFLKKYSDSNVSRLHMPGHKGSGDIFAEKYDITEIDGADVLYNPSGIILESENNASELFKTAHTFYSAEGSTLCIKAMLSLATVGKNKKILAVRNVHKAFIYGAALLDLEVDWLYPDSCKHICSAVVTADALRKKLSEYSELPAAVYVTSPDYLGNLQDIEALSKVCREYDLPLLVDNAHGAYLGFIDDSLHPIHKGAAMCCDSAHKTLPVLTGGAYLHIAKDNEHFCNEARRYLSVYASTSPSYLILGSLDRCNAYLDSGFKGELEAVCKTALELKRYISQTGWTLIGDEPLKITVHCSSRSYQGETIAKILKDFSVQPEYYDRDVVVLMLSVNTDIKAIDRIKQAFTTIKAGENRQINEVTFGASRKVTSIRNAVLLPQETVYVENAVGRVCGAPMTLCPPAVPPVISGELITEDAVKLLKHYGIEYIDVLK